MRFLLCMCAALSLSTLQAHAGSQAFGCSDASGQFSYDGEQLSFRDPNNPGKLINVNSKKISETLVASREETCTTKSGNKFVAGKKTYIVVLEYPQSWDQKLVQDEFICANEYDSYPNADGVDTKCVKTMTQTGSLRDTTLVTAETSK